jgi:N-succinyldiaminopimelate aminotransferase
MHIPEQLWASVRLRSDGRLSVFAVMGVPELRQAVAAHSARYHGIEVDWQTETLITSGATEALAAAFMALVNEGDEVRGKSCRHTRQVG